MAGGAVRGLAGSAITQGIGVATGLQSRFSWTAVAEAGVIGGVAAEASSVLRNGDLGFTVSGSPRSAGAIGNAALSGAAGGIAGALFASAASGRDFGRTFETELPNIVGQTIGAIAAAGEQADQPLLAGTGLDQTAAIMPRDLISADTSQVELLPPIDPNQPLQHMLDYQAAGSSGGGVYAASAIPPLPADAATYLNGAGTFSSSAQEVTVNPSRQLVPDGKYGGAFTLSSTNPNGIAVSFAADPSGAGIVGAFYDNVTHERLGTASIVPGAAPVDIGDGVTTVSQALPPVYGPASPPTPQIVDPSSARGADGLTPGQEAFAQASREADPVYTGLARPVENYLAAHPRVAGVLQAVGGLFEIGGGATATVGGAATAETGVGALAAVGGTLLFGHGLDDFQAGMRTAISGTFTPTITNLVLQAAGASPQEVGMIEFLATVGAGGLAAGARLVSSVGTFAATAPLDLGPAAESEAASGVRAYADGSLRTADGKFASISGVPALGTANASRFADFLSSNGVDVVGQELEVSGPLGPRRYDIVTRIPDGTLHGLEIKSGGATSNAYQSFTDMFINRFSATGRGQITGQQLTGTSKVYLPSGGQ